MDIHKNEKSELRLWAKNDIVPSDLQELCKQAAASIAKLQAENKRLREAFGLARSMVLSGEEMTPQAKEIFEKALKQ